MTETNRLLSTLNRLIYFTYLLFNINQYLREGIEIMCNQARLGRLHIKELEKSLDSTEQPHHSHYYIYVKSHIYQRN